MRWWLVLDNLGVGEREGGRKGEGEGGRERVRERDKMVVQEGAEQTSSW